MNNFIVYCHKNKLNNKRYIGITSKSPQKRWGISGKGYLHKNHKGNFHQPAFAHAILKYGWDNFDHIILFNNLSEQAAKQKEIELISYYRTHNPQFGYNISLGGGGNIKYESETDRLAAYKNSQLKAYEKHKQQLNDATFHAHCLEVRKQWYKNKIDTDDCYHNYVLQKSKQSHCRHKDKLTEEQQNLEKAKHTAQVKALRVEIKNKKIYLNNLIEENKSMLAFSRAAKYIASIKWYKVQSLSKLDTIESDLLNLIRLGKEDYYE